MASLRLHEGAFKLKKEFLDIIARHSYDSRGIFNSELLFFCAAIDNANVNQVIESGRARGYSTAVLAEFCNRRGIDVISIERDKGTAADQVARKKLRGYDNVNFRYGDARRILPNLVNENTAVLIDGPKGDQALVLTIKLLEQTNAPFIAVHDLHHGKFHRAIAEAVFKETEFSDDRKFVDEFAGLDDDCWKTYDNWEPYTRRGREIASYGPTLGLFFNSDSPVNQPAATNYLKYTDRDIKTCAWVIGDWIYSLTYSKNPIVRACAKLAWNAGKRGINKLS